MTFRSGCPRPRLPSQPDSHTTGGRLAIRRASSLGKPAGPRVAAACAVALCVAFAPSGAVTRFEARVQAAQAAPPRPAPQPTRQRRLFPPQDLGLLSAPDRDDWSNPDLIMDALSIADGSVVADLGAGGGWFTIRLARRVGPNGLVYAQDIQPQMIEAINRRVQQEALTNVRTVLGTSTNPRLPTGLDAVLIVDAYREMDEPSRPEVIRSLLGNIDRALKPQGRVGIVDFLQGDGGPGPAAEDRVKPETIISTVEGAGFRLQSRETVPLFQYLLVFTKANPEPAVTPARRRP